MTNRTDAEACWAAGEWSAVALNSDAGERSAAAFGENALVPRMPIAFADDDYDLDALRASMHALTFKPIPTWVTRRWSTVLTVAHPQFDIQPIPTWVHGEWSITGDDDRPMELVPTWVAGEWATAGLPVDELRPPEHAWAVQTPQPQPWAAGEWSAAALRTVDEPQLLLPVLDQLGGAPLRMMARMPARRAPRATAQLPAPLHATSTHRMSMIAMTDDDVGCSSAERRA